MVATRSRVHDALAALAGAARALGEGLREADALAAVADAVAAGAGADVVVVRLLDGDALVARAVAARSAALAAEVHASRIAADALLERAGDGIPAALAPVAARAGADAAVVVAVHDGARRIGSLELYRAGEPFDAAARLVAEVAADQLALALRAAAADGEGRSEGAALELAGDALAAVAETRAEDRIARLAALASGASSATVWRTDGASLERAGAFGGRGGEAKQLRGVAHRAAADERTVAVEPLDGGRVVVTLRLGEPAFGALQLLFDEAAAPGEDDLAPLVRFAVRVAHALRAADRARRLGGELERSRALLTVVGQAIAELSLSHTLRTAAERVAALVGTERVAVYLAEDDRLVTAAAAGAAGPHERVAARLLELALGPTRGRGLVVVEDARADGRLAHVAEAVAQADIDAAIALPLVVREEAIGLLAAYPPRGQTLSDDETALLIALAGQLAVAVQNARLHEQATALGGELEDALAAEREAARKLGALYEISRSFAQSLSLETTLDAVASTVVELLGVDAAAIRMPDGRGAELSLGALHVREPRLAEVARAILAGPQPFTSVPLRRLFRTGDALLVGPRDAAALGGSYALLVPFLEKGSTAAIVPIATPAEVLAALTIVSLEPGRPIDGSTLDAALSIAGQAALAIDNARLYKQQKDFADTMLRSLLPRTAPHLPRLELGAVYESAATVDVGGDVYDYLTLPDGRLAVAVGDVTGHGIDATADMAMAKFVFRSLAREHTEPAAFLGRANAVVAGEIAAGKFITMAYLTADADRGELACASAGHPAPRVVHRGGRVEELDVRGLALGIEPDAAYEEARAPFPAGASVVLYTDGVIEARRRRELYGVERLDRVLAASARLPARDIAQAVLADCRSWSGGELADDLAVVVIRRTE